MEIGAGCCGRIELAGSNVTYLSADLCSWLDLNASRLDTTADLAAEILPNLAVADLFRVGVPVQWGGNGGDVTNAVAAVGEVSARSLTAGFVFWGHRTFIEYLLQSPNIRLREALLPDLMAGRRGGATGLSNAMKFLSGIEELSVQARRDGGTLQLDGHLPWVTNLPATGFHAAMAVKGADGAPAFIAALASGDIGFKRSADLDLMALRGSNTAALKIDGARIGDDRIIHPNAVDWLPRVRPAFLSMQCALSIGLARRALAEAAGRLRNDRDILSEPVTALTHELAAIEAALCEGLGGPRFVEQPASLFRLRIRLAEIAVQAVQLELSTAGGRAYLSQPGEGFQRRLREAAFIPIVTPSLVQLKLALRVQELPATIGATA
jgi:alkylation response protein AidB-like acyl-CoA dehydrogenase